MNEFEQQLKAAIRRGEAKGKLEHGEDARRASQIAEFKNLHSKLRLSLTEYIDRVIRKLADHFPGFRIESVFGEAGWGTACARDDVYVDGRTRSNRYSRFEITVRPINEFYVLDLQARGTIANRELFQRGHFQPVHEVDIQHYQQLLDRWTLEFAELYAAKTTNPKT